LTLRRREEHGNTFAPEIELSLGFDGIPLNGEEIIKRYGRKKNRPHGSIRHPWVKSHWRGLGQTTPHPANIGQMIGSQNISSIFDAIIKI
jgi:hypothetical protein